MSGLTERPSRALQLSAVGCVFAAVVLFFGPFIARVDLFYDDVAHHIFWLYRYADAELFPGDISVDYFKTSALWGYRALYATLAPFVDVLQASEWVSVLLWLACALLVWRTAVASAASDGALRGLFAVFVLCAFLTLSVQSDLLPPTGFQRTFALPSLLLTLWALVARSYLWVGVSWLVAALVYPVTLPVQGLTAAIVFAHELFVTRRMPRHWLGNAMLGAVALAVAAIGIDVPAHIGPAYSYEQAMRLPEFGPGGRLDIYQSGGLSWLRDQSTGLGWRPVWCLLLALAVACLFALHRLRCVPFAAWVMATVGVLLWGAMWLFPEQLMFGLYLPNRHSRWAVGIFGIFAFSAAAVALLRAAERRWPGRVRLDSRFTQRGIAVAVMLAAVAVLTPHARRVWARPLDADLENAYAFIASLPKDTLVAAHPDLADRVPVRTRRSVLTSSEISMAWMQGYYAYMKPRVEASLRAAYAARIEEVDTLLVPLGVDVFLTGPSVWSKTGYFEPFNALAHTLLEQGKTRGFVLAAPPAERILFRSGEYYVVRVGACDEGC